MLYKELGNLLGNHMVVNSVVAWMLAQVIKTIIDAVIHHRVDFNRLFGDGGMPSGHSATVTALAVTAGLQEGLGSPIFAISAVLAIIVMHDAMGVRLEAGKHAKAINELFDLMSSSAESEEKMKEFLGHTPLQVCSGAVLGFLVAVFLK